MICLHLKKRFINCVFFGLNLNIIERKWFKTFKGYSYVKKSIEVFRIKIVLFGWFVLFEVELNWESRAPCFLINKQFVFESVFGFVDKRKT